MGMEDYTEQDFIRDYDEGYDWPDNLWRWAINQEFGEYISSDYSDNLGRWTRRVMTIFKIGDRYFAVHWQQGLTEYQESYCEYINEVTKHEYIVTTTVTEWREVERK